MAAGLRFELFFALHAILNDRRPWEPSEALLEIHQNLGSWPEIRLGISDLPGSIATDSPLTLVVERLGNVPARDLACTLLFGLLHDSAVAEATIDGRLTLKAAIKKLPASKRQCLAHVGLFPFDAAKPSGRIIGRLLGDPVGVRDRLVDAIQVFWDDWFRL